MELETYRLWLGYKKEQKSHSWKVTLKVKPFTERVAIQCYINNANYAGEVGCFSFYR